MIEPQSYPWKPDGHSVYCSECTLHYEQAEGCGDVDFAKWMDAHATEHVTAWALEAIGQQ